MIDTPDTDQPRTPPARLTPREAAVYAQARADTVRDLADELARFAPTEESNAFIEDTDLHAESFRAGYARAQGIVTTLRDRITRLQPTEELSEAPCSLPGDLNGWPILCGLSVGHAGPCFPDVDPTSDVAELDQGDRPSIRRALALAIIAATEELGGV